MANMRALHLMSWFKGQRGLKISGRKKDLVGISAFMLQGDSSLEVCRLSSTNGEVSAGTGSLSPDSDSFVQVMSRWRMRQGWSHSLLRDPRESQSPKIVTVTEPQELPDVESHALLSLPRTQRTIWIGGDTCAPSPQCLQGHG